MASLSSTLRPPSLSPQTTHRNLHIITFHLPPSSARFPVPTKLRSPFELSSPLAAPNWRTKVSFFPSFLENKGKKIEEIKQELFDAIAPLDRGAEATPEDQERIDRVILFELLQICINWKFFVISVVRYDGFSSSLVFFFPWFDVNHNFICYRKCSTC